ncbi:hypothetical protein [Pseudorhodoferax sp. Leaf267]|uniref:hypothetical protein n=1 Tax=Pseudorhodoferax sp. Leaf267 TaxID=1736316 RepID=UPI0006FD13BF|nr:hypothetical protein [Pseudorhodoferax sp. Leaf267]KQP12786.1 hypothetical protein ASF43_21490 [Pseudorhodoferax sp. Leaf267]
MHPVRTLVVLAVAWGGLTLAMAQPAAPAAPASAASAAAPAGSPPMAVVGEWQGPFQDTKILKLLDAEDGVACYLYVPTSVPSARVCTGQEPCAIHYPGGIGTVSCVKVREPARAAPKAVPKAAPTR